MEQGFTTLRDVENGAQDMAMGGIKQAICRMGTLEAGHTSSPPTPSNTQIALLPLPSSLSFPFSPPLYIQPSPTTTHPHPRPVVSPAHLEAGGYPLEGYAARARHAQRTDFDGPMRRVRPPRAVGSWADWIKVYMTHRSWGGQDV